LTAIAGIIHLDGRPIDRAVIERMQTALSSYGQDHQNYLHAGNIAVLRVLCRITPEDEFDRQPLHNINSGLVVVFDGRIDNRDELGKELGLRAPELRQMADADLVLRACERWGSDAVMHLLGDFAVACWQARTHHLWLARDPSGQRPLYWTRKPGLFAFATMPKALLTIPGVERALCEERLADYLALIPASDGQSFFKDIFRVEPGQIAELHGESLTLRRYHQFDPQRELNLPSDDDYVEAFREELNRAVACRLRAVGPIASHLSSGFDSSTVTAIAARQLGERNQQLLAYTAVPRQGFSGPIPRGWHGDEGPAARALAARFPNIDHILLRPNGKSPLDGLADEVRFLDRPPISPVNMIWSRAIEQDAARRGVKCMLTGQRGNRSISYFGETYLPTLLRQGRLLAWWREASAIRRRYSYRTWRGIIGSSLGPYVPAGLWSQIEKYRGHSHDLMDYTAIHPDLLARMDSHARARRAGRDLSFRPSANGRKKRIIQITSNDNGDYFAAVNATTGMELRDPTSDVRLLEFCLAVPDHQYQRDGENRWLLRRLMADILPPEILNLRTKGLQAPDWFETTGTALSCMREELNALMASKVAGDYLDLEALEAAVANWPKTGWETQSVIQTYRFKLLRGLAVGTFIRYVEEASAEVHPPLSMTAKESRG